MKKTNMVVVYTYCILFLLSCNKESKFINLSIDNYIKQNIEKQANIANSLDDTNRLLFIREIILKSTFQIPPSDLCKFLPNGEIICIGEGYSYKKNEFDVSYWQLQDDKIYIWKEKSQVPVPGYMKEIWEFKKAVISSDKRSMDFIFKVFNIQDKNYYDLEVLYMGKLTTDHMENYITKIDLKK